MIPHHLLKDTQKDSVLTFNACKKCPAAVTDAMVDLMNHPFMHLELSDWRFKALETFFVQVYGGGEIVLQNSERGTYTTHSGCTISALFKSSVPGKHMGVST